MARDPRVSLLVADKGQPRYVEIRGSVENRRRSREAIALLNAWAVPLPPPEPDAERLS